jgi:hypothetical protein
VFRRWFAPVRPLTAQTQPRALGQLFNALPLFSRAIMEQAVLAGG